MTERISWTVSEFAAMNGLTRDVVYKRIASGELKAARLWAGGALRIFRETFMQQVSELTYKPSTNTSTQ